MSMAYPLHVFFALTHLWDVRYMEVQVNSTSGAKYRPPGRSWSDIDEQGDDHLRQWPRNDGCYSRG